MAADYDQGSSFPRCFSLNETVTSEELPTRFVPNYIIV
jgi:hypothetical protein